MRLVKILLPLSMVLTLLLTSLACSSAPPAPTTTAPPKTTAAPPPTSAPPAATTQAPATTAKPTTTAAPTTTVAKPSPSPTAATVSAAEFYKNKTLEFNVPNDVGSAEDLQVRAIAPGLAKYLGAAAVNVVNRTGASGAECWNRTYQSKPDGLTLSFGSAPSMAIANMFGDPASQFDALKFNYLIGLPSSPLLLLVKSGGYKTVGDLKAKKTQIIIGTPTASVGNYEIAILTFLYAFGIDNAKFVPGLTGNPRLLALSRGEIDCSLFNLVRAIQARDSKTGVEPLVILGTARLKEYPNVPSVKELLTNPSPQVLNMIHISENIMPAGDNYNTGPGVPADRVAFLKDAITKAATEKQAELMKITQTTFDKFLTGQDILAMLNKMLSPQSREEYKKLYEGLYAKYK